MSIRDILVYADPSPASGERLDLAFRLAHRFGAYLIGVVPEDAAAVGDRFATMLRQEALQGDWQMAIGLAASWVTRRAQAADLVVLGQRIPDHSTGWMLLKMSSRCSRPVLSCPMPAVASTG
jgi:nucleotide-binding universal stress UspA family protein